MQKIIISCSSNKHIECVSVTNTVLTTSALLRSRVSHIKPWGKEYGSCRMFSLSASIGPWLVTTSSAKIAQLLSKTQLFSIQNTFSGPANWLFLAFCSGDTNAECVFWKHHCKVVDSYISKTCFWWSPGRPDGHSALALLCMTDLGPIVVM